MGDRGNIIINDGERTPVVLYTHWAGGALETIARAALSKRWRWTDAPYLARIVFQEMLADDKGETGYGISTGLCDNEHALLVLDTSKQTVSWHTEGSKGLLIGRKLAGASFEEFVANGLPEPLKPD